MFLRKTFSYAKSLKIHASIGGLLTAFVLFVIYFLKPFDTGSSNFPFKNLYFLGYGIITFLSYLITHLFSIIYYKKTNTWRLFEELLFSLAFVSITIFLAFYYTEIIINDKPERITNINYVLGWFKIVFLGFGILLGCLGFILRSKMVKTREIATSQIQLFGSLKKDFLYVDTSNIVYLKSEDNYVNVFYFEKNKLKTKLLRSTLTNMVKQLPSFLKVHRSYIVNTNFILALKGNKQNAKLYLKDIDYQIPVSTTFFDEVQKATKLE